MEWLQTLTIIGTTCGLVLYLRKEHREDLQIVREEIKVVREDMKAMDNRWATLFEKFHILDKDVAKFSGKLDNASK